MVKSLHLVIFSLLICLGLTMAAVAQSNRFTVQLEAAPSLDAAQEKVRQLKSQGIDAYIVKGQVPGKGTFYRVRVGMFQSQAEARKFGSDLQKQGVVRDYFITQYERSPEESTPPVKAAATTAKPVQAPPVQPPPAVKEIQTAPSGGSANLASKPVTPAASAPVPAPVAASPTTASEPASASPVNFVKFSDPSIGFSFDRPQTWEGGPLDPKDAQEQKVNAGALFKSYQDAAFINAIWNNLDKANSPDNDNDLIVELILKSMGSGDGTQQMTETSRRVVSENGMIKTFLDLRATFKTQGQDGTLDFLGKAVIVRASKGILLVVTFYSKNGPSYIANVAERVVASVQPPQ